ncbi:MAG: preprotein translocase subunit SecE [Candidatus Omnitrophota bacterium]
MIVKIKGYFQEVGQELKKVSWSTKDELINSTIVIIVSVALLAVFVWIFDLIFSFLMKIIIR